MDAQRVLVTGATGGFGRASVKRFLEAGWTVTALGRNRAVGAALEAMGAHFKCIDLLKLSADGWDDLARGQDVVVHCAALSSPWGVYDDFYQANVWVTECLTQAAVRMKLPRLVHISTPSQYFDFSHRINVPEDAVLPEPVNAYAATKRLAEAHVQAAAAQGVRCVMLRPRAIIGEHDAVFAPRLIRAYRKGRFPLISGGQSLVDLTYMDNAVQAVWLAATQPLDFSDKTAKVYNISNGEPMPIKNAVTLFFNAMNWPVRFFSLPWWLVKPVVYMMQSIGKLTGREPVLTPHSVSILAFSQTLDIRRARAELGYQPSVSVKEGFERYAKWYAEQQRTNPSQH